MNGSELDILAIILESGLVVKFVLILLIISSIASWAIVFFKKSQFSKLKSLDEEFENIFLNSNDLDDIRVKSQHQEISPLKMMFDQSHNELVKIHETAVTKNLDIKEYFKSFGQQFVARSIHKSKVNARSISSTQLSILASISSVSPFVGLFGTVWGIINSFTGLAGGGGTLDAVAPGIAEALVATAVGLAAAIPATWFYNQFQTSLDEMDGRMEGFEHDLLNKIERTVY